MEAISRKNAIGKSLLLHAIYCNGQLTVNSLLIYNHVMELLYGMQFYDLIVSL